MRRFLPSLVDLQAFESAARHLSFTRAADELGVTQSAVSRNIGNLESFLGTPLFDRAGPRLVLTELGASYLGDIPQILERLEEVSIDLVRGKRIQESLQLGATPTMATRWLIPRLGSFLDQHPEISVEVSAIGDNENFEQGEIDCAVLRGTGQWSNVRAVELFPEELVVVCAADRISPSHDPDHFNFNAQPALQNASRHSLWLTWLRLSGKSYSGQIRGPRFENSDMLMAGLLNGLGFAVMPLHYVADDLKSGRLVAPFGPPIPSEEGYWLVVPERKWQDPRTQAFRKWIGTLLFRGIGP